MEVVKLVLYTGLCTCFMSPELLAMRGKLLENPPCEGTKVQFENTCEVCTRPEQSGVCHPGYKCSDVATENAIFPCYYTRLRGWEDFSSQYDITVFKQANQSGPLPLISAISVYQRTQVNSTYGYPALNVTVNVPYMLYGPGTQNEVPESLRMVFSSVENANSRDSHYYANHITRFYRFLGYSPTSNDVLQPKQVQFKCLTGLDVCGNVRVYNVQLTAYAGPRTGSLYIEQNFTVTAYMDEPKWFPVIATAVLPNNSVYVVFNPRPMTGVTHEIYLKDQDGHRNTAVQNFPGSVQMYVCVIHNVEPGTYTAQLLVKYTKHQTEPVARYQSAPLVIPAETSDTGTQEPPSFIDNPGLVLPIIVIVSFVIASVLLLLLYWQRKSHIMKKFCRLSANPQQSKQKAFLLYLREAKKYVPCVMDFLNKKMVVVSDKDWENSQSRPFDLFQTDVKQCSCLLVLWSPSASDLMSNLNNHRSTEINTGSTVQDYFVEAISFSKELSTTGNLKIVVLYIPGYGDRREVPKNIGEHQIFNLTTDCKKLLKYLMKDTSDLNDIAESALCEPITRLMNPPQEGDRIEDVDDKRPDIHRSKKPSMSTNHMDKLCSLNFEDPLMDSANISGHHNERVNISGHHNEQANFSGHHNERVNISGHHDERVNYSGHHDERANFSGHHIERVNINGHHNERANISGHHDERVNINGHRYEPANIRGYHYEPANCSSYHNEPPHISGYHMEAQRFNYLHMPENNFTGQQQPADHLFDNQCVRSNNYDCPHISPANDNYQMMPADHYHVKKELDPPSSQPLLQDKLDSDQGYETKKSFEKFNEEFLILNTD